MQTRQLGSKGPALPALGLGCMGMSDLYGRADDVESVATIQAALDAGISILDTGDFYGSGHNELLIRDAIKGRREQAFIQVKFGSLRDPKGAFIGGDQRPAAIKNFLAYTLRRLGTDYIDLYQPARVNPAVPLADVVGTIGEMVQAGYVRHLGLSEAGAATIRAANEVFPVTALQIEYSLFSRGIEKDILPVCRELGIGLTAYGVLSRGLLSGHWVKDRLDGRPDFRSGVPRFQGENLNANLALVDRLREVADAKGVTTAQLAIAWVLTRGNDIVPLIGARRRDRLREALGALDISLTPDDLVRIAAAVPADSVQGSRYDAGGMAMLDSERVG